MVESEEWIRCCLQKSGAYIDHPVGPDSTVIKVEKRIFAQFFTLKGQEIMTLNCEIMTGQFYRSLYPGIIVRGYHCPSVQQPYFNTFPLDGTVSDDLIREMIGHSYAAAVKNFPNIRKRSLAVCNLHQKTRRKCSSK